MSFLIGHRQTIGMMLILMLFFELLLRWPYVYDRNRHGLEVEYAGNIIDFRAG